MTIPGLSELQETLLQQTDRAGKMIQQVNMFVSKPGNLSSTPKLGVEGNTTGHLTQTSVF